MARDLAAEDRRLVPHPLLDEGVAHAVHQGHAARGAHAVGHRPRGAHVVDDPRPRLAAGEGLAEDRGHEVARHVLPGVVDEEAAVGVPVPGDAQVGPLRPHALDDVAAVLLEQGVGGVVREAPVELEVHPHRLDGQVGEDRRGPHRPHAVRGVEDDLEAGHDRRVHEGEAVAGVVLAHHLRAQGARGGRGVRVAAAGDPLADLPDPGVAGEGERPAAHHLDPVPLLRVVGGGDDRAPVEVVAPDVVVEHVGADDADVGDRRALRAGAFDEGGRELGRGQPAVAAHRDAARAEVVHEGAAHAPGDLGVELRGVEPADVVGLEDAGLDGGHGLLRGGG